MPAVSRRLASGSLRYICRHLATQACFVQGKEREPPLLEVSRRCKVLQPMMVVTSAT